MKKAEFELCQKNGVTDIVEIKIGYDGIVIATARTGNGFNFRLQDLYLGLAKEVPAPAGALRRQPEHHLEPSEPGPAEPAHPGLRPAAHLGHRDAFLELGMAPGGALIPAVKAVKDADGDRFEALTTSCAKTLCGSTRARTTTPSSRPDPHPGFAGRVRLLVPGAEHGHGEARDHRRRLRPDGRGHHRRLSIRWPAASTSIVKKAHVGVTPGVEQFVQECPGRTVRPAAAAICMDRGLVAAAGRRTLAAQRAAATAMTPMAAAGPSKAFSDDRGSGPRAIRGLFLA